MAVKASKSKRAGLSPISQSFFNQIIAPDNRVRFNEDDYLIIDFLSRTQTSFGDFNKKIDKRACCWVAEFLIATVPTRYFNDDYIKENVANKEKHWTEINCDISELRYHHEGTSTLDTIHIVASKIFLEFIDPQTHLLEAQVRLKPMELTERIKKYGPFKTVVDTNDVLNINYFFDASLPQNADLFVRPFTNS